jgi:hypothetical protein
MLRIRPNGGLASGTAFIHSLENLRGLPWLDCNRSNDVLIARFGRLDLVLAGRDNILSVNAKISQAGPTAIWGGWAEKSFGI